MLASLSGMIVPGLARDADGQVRVAIESSTPQAPAQGTNHARRRDMASTCDLPLTSLCGRPNLRSGDGGWVRNRGCEPAGDCGHRARAIARVHGHVPFAAGRM
eukprot:6177335-Pleurochrysis_carterae.AAC.1